MLFKYLGISCKIIAQPRHSIKYEKLKMIARDSLKATEATLNLEIFETKFEYQ